MFRTETRAMCPAGTMFFQANPLVHQELPIKCASFYNQLDHFLLLITGLFTNEMLKSATSFTSAKVLSVLLRIYKSKQQKGNISCQLTRC